MLNTNSTDIFLHLHTYLITLEAFSGKIEFPQNTLSFILDQRSFFTYVEFHYKMTFRTGNGLFLSAFEKLSQTNQEKILRGI